MTAVGAAPVGIGVASPGAAVGDGVVDTGGKAGVAVIRRYVALRPAFPAVMADSISAAADSSVAAFVKEAERDSGAEITAAERIPAASVGAAGEAFTQVEAHALAAAAGPDTCKWAAGAGAAVSTAEEAAVAAVAAAKGSIEIVPDREPRPSCILASPIRLI